MQNIAQGAVEHTASLDGVLVADFSRVLAGPLLAMMLGDLGADVIKVEPPAGDDTRRWGPPFTGDGTAAYSLAANRNKRSVVLDLDRADDRDAAAELCRRADVVVCNLRPGAMERFGLGYAAVSAANAGVVYACITGFGSTRGAGLPGYDPLVQAVGGLMSITGSPEGPAQKVGVALVDVLAGLYGAVAVLAALRHRERTGSGQRIEIDLLTALLASLANQASAFLNAGIVPGRLGNRHPSVEPFGSFPTADRELVVLAGNDRQFRTLCEVIGAPELATDARFATNSARVENGAVLRALIGERLRSQPSAAWQRTFAAARVPAGPVNDIGEAFALAEQLDLAPIDDCAGVRTPRFPARLSGTPAHTRLPPPALDEHGDEIRCWLRRSQR